VGELITSNFAVESQMSIPQGGSMNWSQDVRSVELSVTDHSPADQDDVTVVPQKLLKSGAVISSHQLPFEIRVDDYFANSDILGPMQPASNAVQKATAGNNKKLRVL